MIAEEEKYERNDQRETSHANCDARNVASVLHFKYLRITLRSSSSLIGFRR